MPIARIERTRQTLPPGHQFGDARWTPEQVIAAREVDARIEAARRRIAMTFVGPTDYGIYVK